MMVVSVPAQELRDAGIIAQSANLTSIRLQGVQVDQHDVAQLLDSSDSSEISIKIDYSSKLGRLVEGKALSSVVSAEAKLFRKESWLKFVVVYEAEYALPNAPFPDGIRTEMFEVFAKHNGLLNCWSYIRMQVNNLSSDAGFPILLPLLRVTPEPEKTDSNSQIEHRV